MAILTQEQFMESLRAQVGDDTSDEALAFIQNMSDTYNNLSNQVKESGNWEQKYRENDTEWRRKYKDAFFKTPVSRITFNGFSPQMSFNSPISSHIPS